MFVPRKSTQAGFTLLEILVALALITLLAVGISLTFDGSRSRAQALISTMTELSSANIRLKNDTGCYVRDVSYLLDSEGAECEWPTVRRIERTWNGPYVAPFAFENGRVIIDKVAEGASVGFNMVPGGLGRQYVVEAIDVPDDVVRQALLECNGAADNGAPANMGTGTFGKFKCTSTPDGVFRMLFDTTR